MAKEKYISLDGIPIVLRKSKKSKRVNITVKPIKGVSVSVPSLVSFSRAERVANERLDWIKKALLKMSEYEDRITVFDEYTKFKTRHSELLILKLSIEAARTVIKSGKIIVSFPLDTEIESNENQKIIKEAIIKVLRKEAKVYLPERLNALANKHNLEYNKLSIRNAKTRWGSCSFTNNINLNLHLMRLSDDLIDYVILHELAHTIHKNHGPEFWSYLEEICPNSRDKDKALKKFSLEFY